MKKLTSILLILAAIISTSCEGPMGPPGLPGQDGNALIGTIFEIKGDFTPENEYKLFFEFPEDFKIYDTDIVLVYILWEQTDNQTDIWRLLPQTVVLKSDEGTDVLQYNFDYTVADVQVFLEGTFDFSTLLPGEWQNQIFRIAVLPADFTSKKSVDVGNFNSIINSKEIKLNTIKNISFTAK
jgi:hypothetical protein